MRRLWIALALLAALLGAAAGNSRYLDGFTAGLVQTLSDARNCAAQGDWDEAQALTRQAYESWQQRDGYLHITLRHGDVDGIRSGFLEVLALIGRREAGAYAAASVRLTAQLEQLAAAERLDLKNIL